MRNYTEVEPPGTQSAQLREQREEQAGREGRPSLRAEEVGELRGTVNNSSDSEHDGEGSAYRSPVSLEQDDELTPVQRAWLEAE